MQNEDRNSSRRGFLGTIATGAAALGAAAIATPLNLAAAPFNGTNVYGDADEWFSKVKSKKHKIVFDVVKPNGMMPFAWPRVFLLTNAATGTAEKDSGVVVILRHEGIPYAFPHEMWAKYKFGEVFKIDDDATKAAAVRNAFWKPKPGAFNIPGFGPVPIGINELQDSGVMFCVCNAAMTVYSTVIAGMMNLQPADVLKDWTANLIPGVQVVPSGVWAVGRAQENGCAYCYAE